MQLGTTLAIIALVGAFVSLESERRAVATIAVLAAGIEVAVSLGVLTLSIAGVELPLVLGAILACTGVIILGNTHRKLPIAGSTAVTLVGALQVLVSLGLVHG